MWLCAALVLCWFQSAAAAQTDWQAEGLKALEAKNYPAAVEALTKAVSADPTDFSAHFNLALALSLTGKNAEAIALYRRTLELKPGLYAANLNLGIMLVELGDFKSAILPLNEAVTAKPSEARPALYLGDAFLGAGQFEQAAESYTKAIKNDPKYAAAELGLARVRARQDRLDEALAGFTRAAELNPEYRSAILELGKIYEDRKQPEQAVAVYLKFPDNPAAQERAGELLLEAGKTAEAIPPLEAAVKASPTSANRLALAVAYFRSKKSDQGLGLLAQAIQADSNNFDLRMMAGRALRDEKKYPEAAAQFLKASELKPQSITPWGELATISVLVENFPQALTALDKIKTLGGEATPHLYLRAIILDRMKQQKPALDYYKQFLAAAGGKFPEEEFKSRQRARIIERELSKR